MKTIACLLAVLLPCTMSVISAVPALAADPVKIGVMAPTTGSWASEGQDMVRIVQIMVDEINASGGINGSPVVLEVADDGGTPKTAALAAQRLITSGVVAVVGTYGSSVTEASQDIYDEAGVIQIATGSTSIRLTEKGLSLFFRTCPRDDEQGLVLATQVKKLGFGRVAIVHDNTSYAKGLAEETREIFKSNGVNEVFYDAITPGDRDFTASLTKIKSTNPEAIVFTGYYPEAGTILRQMHDMRWEVPVIGGDATNNVALVEIAGKEAAKGYYFVSPPGPADMKSEGALKILGIYKTKFGALPSSVWAVLAGDAFGVITEAVKAVGPDSKKMGEWLKKSLTGYEGLTGTIAFNEKGDRLGEVYRLYKVSDDGEFVLVP